jgi:acyl-CoA reductase-like NAD-dependent aldehyde dehydrogenase
MASTFELIEPATGERLSSVPQASRDDVDRAVRAADRAFG